MTASLSVSIVTYAPDLGLLGAALRTLAASLAHARGAGSLGQARITVVDNGPGESSAASLAELLRVELAPPLEAELRSGHGNVGYGRGHNLVLLASSADYHLVLNPDVELAPEAIDEALRHMASHPGTVMLAPEARDGSGAPLYLCKRYPSVLVLALRGLAPGLTGAILRKRLDWYEMRDLPRNRPSTEVPLLSGSFMFCRRAPVAALGGFAEAFFLYFEDFDLSLRAAAAGRLAYVPSVRIVHHGGHAARKGLRHIFLFTRSAAMFFGRHGWRWA
jgi:GT2 family glycosyltransferase